MRTHYFLFLLCPCPQCSQEYRRIFYIPDHQIKPSPFVVRNFHRYRLHVVSRLAEKCEVRRCGWHCSIVSCCCQQTPWIDQNQECVFNSFWTSVELYCMAQRNKIYWALNTQTILVSEINSLLFLILSWDFLTMIKTECGQTYLLLLKATEIGLLKWKQNGYSAWSSGNATWDLAAKYLPTYI